MNTLLKIVVATVLGASSVSTLLAAETAAMAPAAPVAAQKAKNWTAPDHKIYGQALCDEIMAKHPELISVTLHGVPPGASKLYTMFAGSFPDRIGNPDDLDDIDVIEKGITIVDPRWHRTKDTVKKFVMMLPLRDASNENVGLIVLAYKNPANSHKGEKDFFTASTVLRDSLKKKIPNYNGLFDAVK